MYLIKTYKVNQRMNKLLAVTFLISFSGAVFSENFYHRTGYDLLRECSQVVNSMDGLDITDESRYIRCMSYIEGFFDSILHTDLLDRVICPDPDITYGQLIIIVNNYLNRYPEYLNLGKGGLVWSALSEEFPCE